MTHLEIAYYAYLILSMGVVVKVGLVLYKNGYHFLYHAFKDVAIATSINKLLLLGYFLMNTAFVLFFVQAESELKDWIDLLEILVWKLGIVIASLGLMHHFNLFAIVILSKKQQLNLQ